MLIITKILIPSISYTIFESLCFKILYGFLQYLQINFLIFMLNQLIPVNIINNQ